MTRLLFLCHGNICRSPMAEFADPWHTGDFDATYADVLAGCTALLAAIPAPCGGDECFGITCQF